MAGRKLKVFQAQFGFYDTIVAASSRAAAMRAWGVRQNVFADGTAKEISDEAAVATAMAHPETVLKRPVGSTGPFEVEPAGVPDVPAPPKRKPGVQAAKPKVAAPPRPRADRSKLDAAEAALRAIDERRKAEEAQLRREQDDLDAKKAAAQTGYVKARQTATAAVVAAREVYRKAGGRD